MNFLFLLFSLQFLLSFPLSSSFSLSIFFFLLWLWNCRKSHINVQCAPSHFPLQVIWRVTCMSIPDPGHTSVPFVIVDSVNKPTSETTHIIMSSDYNFHPNIFWLGRKMKRLKNQMIPNEKLMMKNNVHSKIHSKYKYT